MKNDLEKEKKLKKLQEAAKTAKWGVKDAVDTEKAKTTVSKIANRIVDEAKGAGTGFLKDNPLKKKK